MTTAQLVLLILTGLLAGFIGGVLGVGGGIIMIPALVFVLGLSQHEAQGTSLAAMLAPIGIFAAVNYYKHGYINIKFALILAFVFFFGSYFGSLVAVNLPEKLLKQVFGVLMVLAGIKMFFGK